MAVNRLRLKYQAEAGDRKAEAIKGIVGNPDRLLGVILLGVTVAEIAEGCTALNIAGMRLDDREAKRIAGALRRAGWVKAERSHGKNWWKRGPKWKPRAA